VEEAEDGNDSYEARAIKRKIARKKAMEIAARAQVNKSYKNYVQLIN
jgi:hypothetical protein